MEWGIINPFEAWGPLGGRVASVDQMARALGNPFPSFIGSFPTYTPYTQAPSPGSIIPGRVIDVPWATYWSRDPSTTAVLFNSNDPILAGSRYDPTGYAVPDFAWGWRAITRRAARSTASAVAHLFHTKHHKANLGRRWL